MGAYQHAICINPDHAEPWFNLGITLKIDNQTERIIDVYKRLNVLDPNLSGKFFKEIRNRSQVQGSTFRVKDKEGIEDSKSSLQMFIFPFSFNCWIRTYETDAFIVNTHPNAVRR